MKVFLVDFSPLPALTITNCSVTVFPRFNHLFFSVVQVVSLLDVDVRLVFRLQMLAVSQVVREILRYQSSLMS